MPFTVPSFIGNVFSNMSTVIFGKRAKDLSLQPPKKKSRKTKDYADPYLFANNYHTKCDQKAYHRSDRKSYTKRHRFFF